MYILTLLATSPLEAIIFLLGLVAAVTVHECAHAWTAYRLGDDTPYLDGRVTLNPAAHLDPAGSVLFLLIGMGWGKPVIYNPMRLPRKIDELLVALAGPASNLLFALLLNILAALTYSFLPQYSLILQIVSSLNIALAAFNLVPIPPLDGSSIVAYFWPEYRSIMGSQIGILILLILIFAGGGLLAAFTGPLRSFFEVLTHAFGLIP